MSNTKAKNATTDQISISEEVFISIVKKALDEVPEITKLASGTLVSGIANMFGKKTSDSPIRIDINGEALIVHVNVVVDFGVFIPDVAEKAQNVVKLRISQLSGHEVESVNIYVCDLSEATPIVDED